MQQASLQHNVLIWQICFTNSRFPGRGRRGVNTNEWVLTLYKHKIWKKQCRQHKVSIHNTYAFIIFPKSRPAGIWNPVPSPSGWGFAVASSPVFSCGGCEGGGPPIILENLKKIHCAQDMYITLFWHLDKKNWLTYFAFADSA